MSAGTVKELEAELTALFRRGVDGPLPDAEFNRLALAVFAHQFAHNRPYRRWCEARGATPGRVERWEDIPAVPTDAFKAADLTTVPPEAVTVVYETSGTTQGERHGRHLLPDTRLYDASLVPNLKAHFLPDVDETRLLVLGPTARHYPRSSLGHMFSAALDRWGAPGSGVFWRQEGPQLGCLASALEKAEREGTPIGLMGTAFGFVHFLDYLASQERRFSLPSGSRLMDTGGYKGRSREVPKAELYALYTDVLGIPNTHVINEYGMTEMGSQFYDMALRDHFAGRTPVRRKVPPPWVRTQVVDPITLMPLPCGETGLLRHYDLANLHTVLAIQTDDLGVWQGDGFEILGRAVGAAPRGCSLDAETLPRPAAR